MLKQKATIILKEFISESICKTRIFNEEAHSTTALPPKSLKSPPMKLTKYV